ncbi:7tm 7 domain containing protein [Asbolus verrucosus]|uniref:Gustatory receptor n=1 Tax=Asbolus verrucosus TaxID=1661398 RepID=A0A482VTL9_ASBVE|nr:7tm 7 domain containing protein [Asbolus verrucosus]
MSFKLLRLIFAFGGFLAITPWSVEEQDKSTCQKCYVWTFFAMTTSKCIYAMFNYKISENTRNCIILGAIEILLAIFNFYVMIVLNFLKKRQWSRLLNHLRILKNQEVTKKKTPYYLNFVILIFVYFVEYCFNLYRMFPYENWYFTIMTHVQHFLYFIYNFLLFTVATMLLKEYRSLNYYLSCYSKDKMSLLLIRKIAKEVHFLKRTVNIFDEISTWPLAVNIYFSIMITLRDLLFVIYDFGNIRGDVSASYYVMIVKFCFGTMSVVSWTLSLILLYNSVSEEFEKFWFKMLKLQWNFSNATPKEERQLYNLMGFIKENSPKFTAAGFFVISKTTILNILAAIVNFLIVAVQLSDG